MILRLHKLDDQSRPDGMMLVNPVHIVDAFQYKPGHLRLVTVTGFGYLNVAGELGDFHAQWEQALAG